MKNPCFWFWGSFDGPWHLRKFWQPGIKSPWRMLDDRDFPDPVVSNADAGGGVWNPSQRSRLDNSWDPVGAAVWADHRLADLPTLMKMWCSTCYPIPSMGLVYLPTFTINKSNTRRHIYHTWILWVMEWFWKFMDIFVWVILFFVRMLMIS